MNWEIFALIIYFAAMLSVGIVFFLRNKSKTDKDYFLGGRSMGPWVTAMSAQASDMSAWLLMGLPGSVLAFGLGQAWIGIGLALGTALNWILIARRLRRFSAAANDSITLPQYLSNRFATKSKALQVICAIVFLVCFTVYVASAFVAGAGVFSSMFGMDKSIAMAIFAVILIIYTFLGGYKAVCWTDFFQGLLMIVAVLAVPIILAIIGGLDSTAVNNTVVTVGSGETAAKVIEAGKASFSSAIFNAPVTEIVNGLAWGLGYFGMPHILVRFMSIKKPSMVKKSTTVAIVWVVLALTAVITMAAMGRQVRTDSNIYVGEVDGKTVLFDEENNTLAYKVGKDEDAKVVDLTEIYYIPELETENPDNQPVAHIIEKDGNKIFTIDGEDSLTLGEQLVLKGKQANIFISLARKLFPEFIAGILLAAIIAASMSTADSQLLVASSSFTSDIYKPIIRKKATDKETLWVGRVVVLIVAVVAYFIASSKSAGASAIMDLVENAWAGFGSAFGPVVILSLFWRRFTYKGALAGVIAGAVTDVAWFIWLSGPTGIYELIPGFAIGFIAAVVATLIDKEPSAEVTAIFDTATAKDMDE